MYTLLKDFCLARYEVDNMVWYTVRHTNKHGYKVVKSNLTNKLVLDIPWMRSNCPTDNYWPIVNFYDTIEAAFAAQKVLMDFDVKNGKKIKRNYKASDLVTKMALY